MIVRKIIRERMALSPAMSVTIPVSPGSRRFKPRVRWPARNVPKGTGRKEPQHHISRISWADGRNFCSDPVQAGGEDCTSLIGISFTMSGRERPVADQFGSLEASGDRVKAVGERTRPHLTARAIPIEINSRCTSLPLCFRPELVDRFPKYVWVTTFMDDRLVSGWLCREPYAVGRLGILSPHDRVPVGNTLVYVTTDHDRHGKNTAMHLARAFILDRLLPYLRLDCGRRSALFLLRASPLLGLFLLPAYRARSSRSRCHRSLCSSRSRSAA
jgi:hypothetical protein